MRPEPTSADRVLGDAGRSRCDAHRGRRRVHGGWSVERWRAEGCQLSGLAGVERPLEELRGVAQGHDVSYQPVQGRVALAERRVLGRARGPQSPLEQCRVLERCGRRVVNQPRDVHGGPLTGFEAEMPPQRWRAIGVVRTRQGPTARPGHLERGSAGLRAVRTGFGEALIWYWHDGFRNRSAKPAVLATWSQAAYVSVCPGDELREPGHRRPGMTWEALRCSDVLRSDRPAGELVHP